MGSICSKCCLYVKKNRKDKRMRVKQRAKINLNKPKMTSMHRVPRKDDKHSPQNPMNEDRRGKVKPKTRAKPQKPTVADNGIQTEDKDLLRYIERRFKVQLFRRKSGPKGRGSEKSNSKKDIILDSPSRSSVEVESRGQNVGMQEKGYSVKIPSSERFSLRVATKKGNPQLVDNTEKCRYDSTNVVIQTPMRIPHNKQESKNGRRLSGTESPYLRNTRTMIKRHQSVVCSKNNTDQPDKHGKFVTSFDLEKLSLNNRRDIDENSDDGDAGRFREKRDTFSIRVLGIANPKKETSGAKGESLETERKENMDTLRSRTANMPGDRIRKVHCNLNNTLKNKMLFPSPNSHTYLIPRVFNIDIDRESLTSEDDEDSGMVGDISMVVDNSSAFSSNKNANVMVVLDKSKKTPFPIAKFKEISEKSSRLVDVSFEEGSKLDFKNPFDLSMGDYEMEQKKTEEQIQEEEVVDHDRTIMVHLGDEVLFRNNKGAREKPGGNVLDDLDKEEGKAIPHSSNS